MTKILRLVGVVFALVLLAQLVPYGRNHDNPPVTREPAWDSPATRQLAKAACFDCHSNETRWPWYASVAPISWLLARHVTEGRSVLNFSEFDSVQEEASEAAESVREGDMPLASYARMHAEARLTPGDRDRLVLGLTRTLGGSPDGGKSDSDDD